MRPGRESLRLLALTALLAGAGCGESAPRPNILLISIDTLRADRLGVYGNDEWGRTTSPSIDALAARGTVFDAAWAPRGQTHPSLGAMLSGKYPITTGLRENGLQLLPQHRTVFEHLQRAGFRTGIFLANLDSGDPSDAWAYRGADVAADGFDGRRRFEVRQESLFQSVWDDRVEQAALEFLQGARRGQPFAAWVHFYDVHKPYNPPPARVGDYGLSAEVPEVLRAPGPHSGAALELHLAQTTLGDREVPESELRRIRGLYDAGVSAADERVGRLLGRLSEIGALENTIVVLTADHGEELFDHNRYFFHGNSIYVGTLRLPLIVAGPGLAAGVRTEALVQNIDIAPTLLDLAGVAPAPDMEGASLLPVLRGQTQDGPRPFAFIEWQDALYAVTDGRRFYVHNPQHAHPLKAPFRMPGAPRPDRGFQIDCFEAYDLPADRLQQLDLLAALDPATLGRPGGLPEPWAPLRAALEAWLAHPDHEREMSWPGFSPAAVERMAELGYTEAGRDRPDVMFMESCSDGSAGGR